MGEGKRKHTYRKRSGESWLKSKVAWIVIILSVSVIGIVDYVQREKHSPLFFVVPERSLGNPEAALKIIEFIDFQSPECARGTRLLEKYMNNYFGEIYLSSRYFSQNELNSNISARYSECALRQGKFREFNQLLFKRQAYWRELLDPEKFFAVVAKNANLDLLKLEECVEKKEVYETVEKDYVLAESHFVRVVPTYLVNQQMVEGVEALESFLQNYFEKLGQEVLIEQQEDKYFSGSY